MGGSCHLAHAGAPRGKVLQHRAGHAGIGLAHALGHHAVIGAQHQHGAAGKIQLRGAGQGGGILQHGFQAAQPTQRFGQRSPVGVRRSAGRFIRRGDGLQPCVQFGFGHTVPPVFVWAYCAAAVTKRCGSRVPAQYKCGNPAYRCPLTKPQSQWRPLAF